MKPWREVARDARHRGAFSQQDMSRWLDIRTCPAAELVLANGLGSAYEPHYRHEVHTLGTDLCLPLHVNDFDGFDSALDRMEDVALRLKRGELVVCQCVLHRGAEPGIPA